jgi:hypothetical protein
MSLPEGLAPTAAFSSGPLIWTYASDVGWVRGDENVIKTFQQPLPAVPGRLLKDVSACGAAIHAAAQPHGRVRSETTAAGPERHRFTGRVLPVEARLTYLGWFTSEVRQARVACLLQPSGQVIGLSTLSGRF